MNKVIYILILLIFSICILSPISAGDNASYVDTQSTISDGNFKELSTLVQNTSMGDTLVLDKDYKFDNSTDSDYAQGIALDFITIDGAGHIIDADGQSRIFRTFNNVTLNNIGLINAYADYGGAIYSNLTVTCNNVSFENNGAKVTGGAIFTYFANLNNCSFNSNYALNGSCINIKLHSNNELELESKIANCQFFNMKSNALITDSLGKVVIDECIFKNITSDYGAAITVLSSDFITVNNSMFINLSSISGGSIFTYLGSLNIYNSEFINSTAYNNGGALLLDSYGGQNYIEKMAGNTLISNCRFSQCFAKFGGVLVRTGGSLSVVNSTFNSNFATYYGGAIYTSILNNFTVENSSFTNNKANRTQKTYSPNGGAIYSLFNPVSIRNSTFTDNSNNAIYLNGCELNLTNSIFENNNESIHHYYAKSNNISGNTFINDHQYINDTNKEYNLIVSNSAIVLPYVNNTIDVTNLPARFDVREWGWDSGVKDQTITSGCWAFATISGFESTIRKATGLEYNASTRNMHRNMGAFSEYGSSLYADGVNDTGTPVNYLVSWFGPISETYDPLDNFAKIDTLYLFDESIHVQDVMIIRGRNYNLTNDDIKRLLITYGEITTAYGLSISVPDFNINTSAAYSENKSGGSHAMVIVGWDDKYPAENFYKKPAGDGAWIYKNSYGTNNVGDDKGYVYISYYDVDVFSENENYIVLFENRENYTRNYQTDLGGELRIRNSSQTYGYKNSYQSIRNEVISGVGTYFNDENESFTLEIYVNGQPKLTQSGSAPFYGYNTVILDKEIPVKINDNFTVLMKKNSVPIIENSRIHFKQNVSFVDFGDGWNDLALEEKTLSLKVYTKDLMFFTDDLVKIYMNDSKFEASVGVENATVTFEVNGCVYNRTADENGVAKISINLRPGNYTIKTTFNGTSVENTIEVLPTLIAQNLVKYFRNNSQFDISLIDGRGNNFVGINVTMNINGVFYNRTTDEKGMARLNINLDPGKYILTATDSFTGLQMSYNITVLPVLNATDIEMAYKDGTQFKASIVDGTGVPLSGVKITFNINGVFYGRITDGNGVASLNINLMAGEYIITSQYESARISNKITIYSNED